MGQLSNISVKQVDNELIVLAMNNTSSQVICHMKGGNANPVSFAGTVNGILPSGSYNILLIGINWGGPANFSVTLTINGTATVYNYANPGAPIGVVWNQVVPVTV